MRRMVLAALGVLTACGPHRPPPPSLFFAGLPVSGSLADARRAGLTNCFEDTGDLRCRRDGVMVLGQGPFNVAVDLAESDGSGGFDHLTIWHDRDQDAVYAIGDVLMRQGWRECYTSVDDRGDQAIYTRNAAPMIAAMDLSYWGKRRFRLLPPWNRKDRRC